VPVPDGLARLVSRLRRAYRLTAGQAALFGEGITPVVVVDDVMGTAASDQFYQKTTRAFGSQPAVAAEFSHVQIRNPVGSGVNYLLERVLIAVGADVTVEGGPDGSANLATVVATNVFRDQRIAGRPATQLSIDSSVASLVTSQWSAAIEAIHSEEFLIDELIPPGQGWNLRATTLNVQLNLTYFGKEIPLQTV